MPLSPSLFARKHPRKKPRRLFPRVISLWRQMVKNGSDSREFACDVAIKAKRGKPEGDRDKTEHEQAIEDHRLGEECFGALPVLLIQFKCFERSFIGSVLFGESVRTSNGLVVSSSLDEVGNWQPCEGVQ